MVREVFAQFGALSFALFRKKRIMNAFAMPGSIVEAFGMSYEVEGWWHIEG